jgi:cyclohexanone monooxygenase
MSRAWITLIRSPTSCSREWRWTERYASLPEILKYLNHVADRFDLRGDVQLSTRIAYVVYDETTARWTITTDRGDSVAARFCIMATGCLSTPQFPPPFPGLESFQGCWYHTGRWPHEGVDLTGQRVAVIGTGSSAIQSIPLIAEQAAHVYVFQRTANYSIPAHNGPLDAEYEKGVKAEYPEFLRRVRESRGGFVVPVNDQPTLSLPSKSATANTRRAGCEAASASVSPSTTFWSTNRPTTPRRSFSATRFGRSWVTQKWRKCCARATTP